MPPSISIHGVLVTEIEHNTMTIPIAISSEKNGEKRTAETKALLDTGAGGKFIDQNYVREQELETKDLKFPIKVYNVDGTPNKRGTITKYVNLKMKINGRVKTTNLLVTGLGKQKIILGYPWFKNENPDINWTERTLTWRTEQDNSEPLEQPTPSKEKKEDEEERKTPKPFIEEIEDEELWKTKTINPIEDDEDNEEEMQVPELVIDYMEERLVTDTIIDEVWINAKTNVAMELAIKDNKGKVEIPVEELVPKDLHDFMDVFSEQGAS